MKYNSANILCGKQGKCKTLTILWEVIKIFNVPNCDVHILVYVNRDGRKDATAKVLSSLGFTEQRFPPSDYWKKIKMHIFLCKQTFSIL